MLRLNKGPKLDSAINVASSSSSVGSSKKYCSRLGFFQGFEAVRANSLTMAALVSSAIRFGNVCSWCN
ncbi:hypothetical protein K443DRAFT_683186 [Laccaria amethystina LaAM-08-1]|uniref:Unplaced genomic scaffold K443scaffold_228, whole genome shotgun sequence n=1 Tax=Laccaria amethystina LaAM-08-1 TaxID=1095629 RepID=A0A0C9WTG1_9AGAR|nr:hypothetical protein K443DRAFT_683186 [Laccaria amethystina LaAM-08-1]